MAAGSVTMWQETATMVYDLRWLMALCLTLVVADLVFGVQNALKHGKPFRKSTAVRRTMNKLCDYFCWLLLGGLLGRVMGGFFEGQDVNIATGVVLVAIGCELESCFQNYMEFRGVRFSLRGFLRRLLVRFLKKKDQDLGEALEETLKENDNGKKSERGADRGSEEI